MIFNVKRKNKSEKNNPFFENRYLRKTKFELC